MRMGSGESSNWEGIQGNQLNSLMCISGNLWRRNRLVTEVDMKL